MKFSIVTITNNRAHLICETLKSVLEQSYSNFEHIIIDDGSSDNTEEIIKSFSDNRINYYKYPKHPKRSFLRNEGIRKSKGDIICILDSDDSWHKDKLAVLFELFNTRKDVVFNIHNVQKSNGSLIYNYKKDFHRNIVKDILANDILPYPFYSFRKSVLNKIEMYDETMVDGQHDFFLRLASQYDIYFSSKILAIKHAHPENISKTPRVSALINYNTTLQKLLDQKKISIKEFNHQRNLNNFKIAKFYYHNNDKTKCIDFLNKVLDQAPLYSKTYLKTWLFKYSNF